MADPKAAVDVVLRQEDAALAGTITNAAADPGGLTRFGLCAKFHPELVAAGFFAPSMPAAAALPLAEQTYEAAYTAPLKLAQIASQGCATALLSFAVNEGTHEGVLLLQRALSTIDASVVADGDFGPATLAALNAANDSLLAPAWAKAEDDFYDGLAAAHPSQGVFLKGWLNRVAADCELVSQPG